MKRASAMKQSEGSSALRTDSNMRSEGFEGGESQN